MTHNLIQSAEEFPQSYGRRVCESDEGGTEFETDNSLRLLDEARDVSESEDNLINSDFDAAVEAGLSANPLAPHSVRVMQPAVSDDDDPDSDDEMIDLSRSLLGAPSVPAPCHGDHLERLFPLSMNPDRSMNIENSFEVSHFTILYWTGAVPREDPLPDRLDCVPKLYAVAKSVVASGNTVAVLSDTGDIHIHSSSYSFERPLDQVFIDRALTHKWVVALCVGESHVLALLSSGVVGVLGSDSSGQLGLPGIESVSRLTYLPKLQDITAIGAGAQHSVAISSSGCVYCWGHPLGCGSPSSSPILRPEHLYSVGADDDYEVAASLNFTVIVKRKSGEVFTFGANESGQCGAGTSDKLKRFGKLNTLPDGQRGRIVRVACGHSHCVALSQSGSVYVWGGGSLGQLGLGVHFNGLQMLPNELRLRFGPISNVFAGENSSFFLLADGDLYGCGNIDSEALYATGSKIGSVVRLRVPAVRRMAIGHNFYIFEFRDDRSDEKMREERSFGPWGLMTLKISPLDLIKPDRISVWRTIFKSRTYRNHTSDIAKMYYAGIPNEIRRTIWLYLIGNPLHITPELYTMILSRIEDEYPLRRSPDTRKRRNEKGYLDRYLKVLYTDLPRTFSSLCLFGLGQPLHQAICDMLEVFVFHRSDIQYVQSLSFIAGVLCLFYANDKLNGFTVFVNLLHKGPFISLLRMEPDELEMIFQCFSNVVEDNNRELSNYLLANDIMPSSYLIGWIMTIFTNILPFHIAFRIWDLLFYEGTAILYQAAFSILDLLFPQMRARDPLEARLLLSNTYANSSVWCDCINEETLIDRIRNTKISKRAQEQLFQVDNDLHIFRS